MFKPTKFYPANIINNGKPSLWANHFDTAHEAKNSVQKLIDNNDLGTKNHVLAGYAYFNKDNDIVYVFPKKEDMIKALVSIKKMVSTGGTRQYAKLKMLKNSAISTLNKLNNKELADKVIKVNTFKELGLLLDE